MRKLVAGACLLVATVGCGVDEGMRRPRIRSFSVTPAIVAYGSYVTLSWEVESTRFVAIEAAYWPAPDAPPVVYRVPIENGTDPRGSAMHRPMHNTRYTLLAYPDDGETIVRSDSADVTLTGSPPVGVPAIETFYADPIVVSPGGTSRLQFEVIGADRADLYVASGTSWTTLQSYPGLDGREIAGTFAVTPSASALYRFQATNAVGSAEAYARVTVDPSIPSIPRVVSFSADPEEVAEGGEVTITWETEGATAVELVPAVRGFPTTRLSGSFTFTPVFDPMPIADKTYRLRATAGGRTAEASVTIRVRRPSIVSFTATPGVVAAGGTSVVLAWETADAGGVEVAADPPDRTLPTTVPPVVGTFTVNPSVPTVYTLTALGSQGSRVRRTASVLVVAPGDLVITEVQFVPAGLTTEADGEWFEAKNVAGHDIPLDAFVLSDGTATDTLATTATLASGDFVVFGAKDDVVANGGVAVDVVYAGLSLPNSTGSLEIAFDGVTIDAVTWSVGGEWTAGAAWSLDPASTHAVANDTAANWCAAADAYGMAGNYGTPGAANPVCP